MAALSSWLCSHSAKAKLVRIVHPGGHVELHDGPVRAAEIMLRNPRCYLTHPHPFQQPREIVVPDAMLLLGRKYYLVPANSIEELQEGPTPTQAMEKPEDENENSGYAACFNGGSCIMCLVDGMKIGKENERSPKLIRSEISCRMDSGCCGRSEEKRIKRRGFFAENGNNRGSPKRHLASSDNWHPSLDSITEE